MRDCSFHARETVQTWMHEAGTGVKENLETYPASDVRLRKKKRA